MEHEQQREIARESTSFCMPIIGCWKNLMFEKSYQLTSIFVGMVENYEEIEGVCSSYVIT